MFEGGAAGCGLTEIPYAGETGVSVVVRCLPAAADGLPPWLYAAKDGVNFCQIPLPSRMAASIPEFARRLVHRRAGYGSATSGEIYRTTDGGRMWRFVLATGWQGPLLSGCGTRLGDCPRGEESALVRTANGGLLWEEILPVTAP